MLFSYLKITFQAATTSVGKKCTGHEQSCQAAGTTLPQSASLHFKC